MEGGEGDESDCESGCESGGPRVAFTMGDSPKEPRGQNGGRKVGLNGGPRAAEEGGRPGRPPGDPMASQTMAQFYSFAPEPLHHFEHVKAGHRTHHSTNGHKKSHGNGHKKSHGHGHGHGHGHRRQNSKKEKQDPGVVVRAIIGEAGDGLHDPHPLFCELSEIRRAEGEGEDGPAWEWKETARWVKFEEDVEEGANRWSKPHVSSLSMHSLMELRSFLKKGTVFLDLRAANLREIMEVLLENMVNNGQVTYDKMEQIQDAVLAHHRHQFEGIKKSKSANQLPRQKSHHGFETVNSLAKISEFGELLLNRGHKSEALFKNQAEDKEPEEMCCERKSSNVNFCKKLPKDSEASNILVGVVDFLEAPVSAFIRLEKSVVLGDLTEVSLKTRFLFLLLGPKDSVQSYKEIGRSMASSFADEVFHEVAYKAHHREHLIAGLDEFLDKVTVLPPGEWDPAIRIEPPVNLPSQNARKQLESMGRRRSKDIALDEEEEKIKSRRDAGLVRSGRLFGGLMADIRRKRPHYWSDFRDGISMKSVSTIIFLYFATLAPIVAFGGLLGDATGDRMASIEALVSGLVAGTLFGLLSGQPLTILGLTGPDLVFESLVSDFCVSLGWEYLSFRVWIGLWLGLMLIVLVATDASFFVCYITRFTEECFACLIAIIFIIKAIQSIVKIAYQFPIHPSECLCLPLPGNYSDPMMDPVTMCNITDSSSVVTLGTNSPGCSYVPNVFFMSCMLFFGTYLIATTLKQFKNQRFLPTIFRAYISDFAVIIAIILMVILDILFDVETPKLNVPDKFAPTWEGRGWVIHPFGGNPWWTALLAAVPAALATILIFMDQQITAVIVNRKENLLRKGGGYHLDLLIVAVGVVINSVLGIPWYVASTILSVTHVQALKMETETAAPGEKAQFLGVRENRVTHVVIFILVGLSAFMSPVLAKIPMPVLYGVFLYMGISSLDGIQMFDRMLLFLMPKKYQPDYPYLRAIPTSRVHLFTILQLFCFISLWLIQTFKQTSILFPIMLVLLIGIRKAMDFVFSPTELKVLDDILPASKRTEILDLEEIVEAEDVEAGGEPPEEEKDEEDAVDMKMSGMKGSSNTAYSVDPLKTA